LKLVGRQRTGIGHAHRENRTLCTDRGGSAFAAEGAWRVTFTANCRQTLILRRIPVTKTIEYRRHKGQFNARVFYSGRRVRIAYNYKINLDPSLTAMVTRFEVAPSCVHI